MHIASARLRNHAQYNEKKSMTYLLASDGKGLEGIMGRDYWKRLLEGIPRHLGFFIIIIMIPFDIY